MLRKFRKRAHPTGSSANASGANAGPAKMDVATDLAPPATQPSVYSDHNINSRNRNRKCDSCPRTTQLHDLPGELLQRIADQLPPNEVPCSLRLVCRELASRLHSPQHITIRLGTYQQCGDLARRALVPAALLLHRWAAPGAGSCLTLKQKQQLLCCAARCGSVEVLQQLEAALGCEAPREAAWSAAEEGHGHVCDWVADQMRTWHNCDNTHWRLDDVDQPKQYWERAYLALRAATCAGQKELHDRLLARRVHEHDPENELWVMQETDHDYAVAANGSCHQQVCELMLRHAEAGQQASEMGKMDSSGGSSSSSRLQDAAHGCLWAMRLHNHDLGSWLMKCIGRARRATTCGGEALPEAADQQRGIGGPAVSEFCALGYAAYGCDLPTLRRLYNVYARRSRQEQPTRLCLSARRWRSSDSNYEIPFLAWLLCLSWAMAGAMCSPTSDWRAKVEWLVREQGCPRGPEDLLRRRAAAKKAVEAAVGMSYEEWVEEREDGLHPAACFAAGSSPGGGPVAVGGVTPGRGHEGMAPDGGMVVGVDLRYVEDEEEEDDLSYRGAAEGIESNMERAGRWLAAQPYAAERYRWLRGQGFEIGGLGMLEEAVGCGNTELVEELLEEGSSSSSSGSECSGGSGGSGGSGMKAGVGPTVNGIPEAAVTAAAGRGHVGVLRPLHMQGRRMGIRALHAAAVGGHLETVEWLLRVLSCAGGGGAAAGTDESRPPPVQQQGNLQAQQGQGQAQEDARATEQDSVLTQLLTAELLTHAARSGSRRLVVWLSGLGCPWTEGALAAAAEGGSEELVEWAVRSGECPMGVSPACFMHGHAQQRSLPHTHTKARITCTLHDLYARSGKALCCCCVCGMRPQLS